MEWYQTTIIILSVLTAISSLLVFFGRDSFKIKIKAFLTRNKDYLKYTELCNNKKIQEGVAKIIDGEMNIGKKVYSINKEDVYFGSVYSCPEVIISEKTGSSVNPESENNLSPTVVDGLLKRVKATALGESLKIIKLITLAIGILGLAVIVCAYISYKVYSSVRDSGVEVKL